MCARASVPSLLIHEATDAPRDIRLRWRGRERTLVRADAHVRVQGMDRRSRASLFLRVPSFLPSHNPLVSRFLPPLASFHPSLPSQPLSFLSSLFLSLSFYDPRSALPPTRLVRTIGVSTLETLHAWHTCKRARKSTQYRYRCADTREICPKTCQDSPRLVFKGAEGDAEKIERKMYPSSYSCFI